MAYQDSKYSIKIDSEGYVISHRNGKHFYQKRRAPQFVSRNASGDVSYRDSTFWQFWVQTNWRNGSKQLKWDDPGKFWKSSNVNVSGLEELTLSKALVSAGQIVAGTKINAIAAWRSSQSWWNSNYGYRKQITITAPSGKQLPVGYPIVLTENSDTIQTAGHVLANRNDWRVVYWNGSSWVDLKRDYVSASRTVFALQVAIAANASDTNYYVYYGYSSEATSQQPSTDADWNAVYGMYGTTPDANSLIMWHCKEGSGNSITDTDAAWDGGTINGNTLNWATDGPFGRNVNNVQDGENGLGVTTSGELDVGSFTIEWFAKSSNWGGSLCNYGSDGGLYPKFKIQKDSNNKIYFEKRTGTTTTQTVYSAESFLVNDTNWHHYAIVFDGSSTAYFYRDGTLFDTQVFSGTAGIRSVTGNRLFFFTYSGVSFAHVRFSNAARSSFPYAIMASEVVVAQAAETTTQPPSSNFTGYAGLSDGRLFSWDGNVTWAEAFNTRNIEWYDVGDDAGYVVGDAAGTETAQAQSFQLTAEKVKSKVKGVMVYLKKNAGTPGDIIVRIETDNAGKPSGNLADAKLAGTITAFTSTSSGWYTVEFAGAVTLTATTTYWLVLKTAAAANDNNYHWRGDSSSPSYSTGSKCTSSDGGATWAAADTTVDFMFRILGNATSINKILVSAVGGTQKMLLGTGDPDGQENGDARLYSFDGSTYALEKVFNTSTESAILSLTEYVGTGTAKLYAGLSPQARVYESTTPATWTQSKKITTPQNPGYVWALKEYNSRLFAGGGTPEFLPTQNYDGFVYVFDSTTWFPLYPFDFTVIRSCEFYDAFLFMGTYHGHLFVYDTSSLNPLFNFKDDYNYSVVIRDMKYFDDKLYIALYPQAGSGDTNSAIWVFERHGLSAAHVVDGVAGYRCMEVVNNTLLVGTGDDGYVYKLDPNTYVAQGWVQTSYFDANLPSIDKLWSQITIKHDALVAGTSVKVYYRFRETDAWTLLGTSSTVGDESETFSFPAGIYSKKITLKIELNTTDTSKTPRVTEYVTRYTIYPTRKWQWNIRVLAKSNIFLADKSVETRTAAEIRADLEAAQNAFALNTFVDIDGVSYNVLFTDIDQSSWVINEDDANEDEVSLTLLEA